MAFKIEKRPDPGTPVPKGLSGPAQALIVLGSLLVMAWGIKQAQFPDFDPCAACGGTGSLSCGAPGCDHGKTACTGPCLKRESPGWQHMDVPGHSPDELWMRFDDPSGSWHAWTQAHIGEAIELVNGEWVNTGKCTVCGGTTRMPCPACHGERRCPECGGSGKTRRWIW